MAIDVETKDTTALSDAELSEMGDICADGPARYDIGLLSKQREEWVLVSLARDASALVGFSFSTLERIGGTPSVLIGVASVQRSTDRSAVLHGLMADQFRRAVLAFPDEDVIIGTRLVEPSGFEAFRVVTALEDVVPRPDHKATGEERAWGRRLAKRFGVDAKYEDRAFLARGTADPICYLDHESLEPDSIPGDVRALFDGVDRPNGDCLIAFGWAMAEDLAALK